MTDEMQATYPMARAEWLNASEALETNTHEEYRLKEKISYASARLTELEYDEMVLLVAEYAAAGTKSNADDRASEVAKRLKAHGIYQEKLAEKIKDSGDAVVVTAHRNRLIQDEARHRQDCRWYTAQEQGND